LSQHNTVFQNCASCTAFCILFFARNSYIQTPPPPHTHTTCLGVGVPHIHALLSCFRSPSLVRTPWVISLVIFLESVWTQRRHCAAPSGARGVPARSARAGRWFWPSRMVALMVQGPVWPSLQVSGLQGIRSPQGALLLAAVLCARQPYPAPAHQLGRASSTPTSRSPPSPATPGSSRSTSSSSFYRSAFSSTRSAGSLDADYIIGEGEYIGILVGEGGGTSSSSSPASHIIEFTEFIVQFIIQFSTFHCAPTS